MRRASLFGIVIALSLGSAASASDNILDNAATAEKAQVIAVNPAELGRTQTLDVKGVLAVNHIFVPSSQASMDQFFQGRTSTLSGYDAF